MTSHDVIFWSRRCAAHFSWVQDLIKKPTIGTPTFTPSHPHPTVLCLLTYFPKLINLHVFCALLHRDLNDILRSFTFNDATGTEYLRRVNRIKEREEKDSLDHLEMINEPHELLKSLHCKKKERSLTNEGKVFDNYQVEHGSRIGN